MYQGLVKLVLVDPSIGGLVFDFLLPHFLQFFKEVVIEASKKPYLKLVVILNQTVSFHFLTFDFTMPFVF